MWLGSGSNEFHPQLDSTKRCVHKEIYLHFHWICLAEIYLF